jgi:hypothetical protein
MLLSARSTAPVSFGHADAANISRPAPTLCLESPHRSRTPGCYAPNQSDQRTFPNLASFFQISLRLTSGSRDAPPHRSSGTRTAEPGKVRATASSRSPGRYKQMRLPGTWVRFWGQRGQTTFLRESLVSDGPFSRIPHSRNSPTIMLLCARSHRQYHPITTIPQIFRAPHQRFAWNRPVDRAPPDAMLQTNQTKGFSRTWLRFFKSRLASLAARARQADINK